MIPAPRVSSYGDGSFVLRPTVSVVAAPELVGAARHLVGALESGTGWRLAPPPARGAGSIRLRLSSSPPSERPGAEGGPAGHEWPDESYTLRVDATGVEITAATEAGAFYAVQSFRQLLPAETLRAAPVRRVERLELPFVEIVDAPAYRWRGAHLDVARHLLPTRWILHYLDLMALHKLNVLHLHLTDDQGWRVEITKYPRLTEVGAWRRETMAGEFWEDRYDGVPYGGYYTQDDLREIVAYAAERHITVVPEIDMPGHMMAAIAAYPWLGNAGVQLEVLTAWGIAEHVLNVEEKTLEFVTDVLDEICDVFPSRYIHVGGDECPRTEWATSPRVQQLMRERGLASEDELQSWFVRRLEQHLTTRGRVLVGWDEILRGGLSDGAVVMSWNGDVGGVRAALDGHDVVMAPEQWTYFDLKQSDDPAEPAGPPVRLRGYIDLERAYAYDPMPAALPEWARPHVLGAQCQLWTEYVRTPDHAEYMLFPRVCAFAEVVWLGGGGARGYDDFLARLTPHLARLDASGVGYRPLTGPARRHSTAWPGPDSAVPVRRVLPQEGWDAD